nr:MAG TPA: hypothetical protein [Bacteriophage sp.]
MKVGDTYMYLPEEVILRVNKIEGDTVFYGPEIPLSSVLVERQQRLPVLHRPCRKRTRTI